ncbi:hypothetical protein WJ969_11980 [Achromobacter xylosoxidans]
MGFPDRTPGPRRRRLAHRVHLDLPAAGPGRERIAIDERFASAQSAIDEATRLAQIHVADLNGDTATFDKPTAAEQPFGRHTRF